MAGRIHVLFLTLAAVVPLVTPAAAVCAESPVGASQPAPEVVEAKVQRRKVTTPAIDTENFEGGLFVGTVSIEDFGSSVLYGGQIAYHFSEDLFAEATIGFAEAGKTSYEDLSGSAELLTDGERNYTYYDLALGWNALPGEVFLGSRRAMPSALYLSLGAGSTRFGGDDHFTLTLGAGFRLLATDWLAARLGVRDQMFESDLLGKDKLTHNLQLSLGLTAFF
jgi:outer membrane beta-barrel protein